MESKKSDFFKERSQKYKYQSGFGNEFISEARPNIVPQHNNPQLCAEKLYAEQISGTAFTVNRDSNRRTWVYRALPSVVHTPFKKTENGLLYRGSFETLEPNPNQKRWDPIPLESIDGKKVDFSQGLISICGAGGPQMKTGMAIHNYVCNTSMTNKAMYNSDGEMLIVPQVGRLDIQTELGFLEVEVGEIVVIPRGIYFSVTLTDGPSRGYICEVYESQFNLPNLGVLGANALAYARHFLYPVAAYDTDNSEDENGQAFTIINKFQNQLFTSTKDSSPFNVVGWAGNYAPYKYDLNKFMTINSVSFDHPDPSIYCVLTAPTALPGVAVCDFVIFPSRWVVMDHTFRPPYYHRNTMCEYMGLIRGKYDAKPSSFKPGGASLHNTFSAHGPDSEAFEVWSKKELVPERLENTMAFMFETYYILNCTNYAENNNVDGDYWKCWQTLKNNFTEESDFEVI